MQGSLDYWAATGVLTALIVLWWGLMLLRRIRDRHLRIVVGLVGLVTTYQGLHLAIEPRGWTWFAKAVGVLCSLGALVMMERLVRKQRTYEFALRLSEAREMPRNSTQALELAVLASEARARKDVPRSILESAPMAMFAVELDGSVSFWNAAAERLLGWK